MQEKKASREKFLMFFLLDTLKTAFWIENLTQIWIQSGPLFSENQGTFSDFQKRAVKASPHLVARLNSKKNPKKNKKQLNGNQDTKPEINKDINTLSKELLKKTGDDGSVKTCYSESSQKRTSQIAGIIFSPKCGNLS